MNETSVPQAEIWRERWHRLRARFRPAVPFASGALAALVTIVLYNLLIPGPHLLTPQEVQDTVAQTMASATPPPPYSSSVYQVIRPSLVLIQTQSQDSQGNNGHALGSGVIISDQGDILTSLHVVADATKSPDGIQVTFADGTQSPAEVVTSQPENDIAVLQASMPPAQIIPAVLGNPRAMQVGDPVYAVGNPFGLYSSMSAGVVSGFDRSFQAENSGQKLQGLIQMDAAVNPGNSGGPLVNRYGQVVGIVVGILNPTREDVFIGIGFAVPINVAGGAAGSPPY